VAEPNDEIPKINPSEVETLIEKIEQNTLSEQDKRKITRLLRTLLYVVGMLQEKKITLLRLKEMVFGKKSEKMKRGEGEKGEPKDGPESDAQEGGKGGGSQTPKNEKLEEAEGGTCPSRKFNLMDESRFLSAKSVVLCLCSWPALSRSGATRSPTYTAPGPLAHTSISFGVPQWTVHRSLMPLAYNNDGVRRLAGLR
jgi:hypothetical protein